MKATIVDGCRTPFVKAGTVFEKMTAIDLGTVAVRELLARADLDPSEVDHLIFGTVVHAPRAPNMAREIGLATLPRDVPAYTVSRQCASANQAITDAVDLIETGRADVVVAGGSESLSHIPITVSERLSRALLRASRAKSMGGTLAPFRGIRPGDLLPQQPEIAEPSTGETMGEGAEKMAKMNGIGREEQDAWALRSHRLAAEGTDEGPLADEIVATYVPPDYETVVTEDNGVRRDTSMEALAGLPPVFDREHGSVTAGSSSPLTDGASAVLVMSAEKARALGYEPPARVRSYAYAAVDPAWQLLQAPAFAVPRALDRAGVGMDDIGLVEMHEAFSAQVLSNLQAWDSDAFAREELGRNRAVGAPDREIINVMGGSIAIGHPFGATGGRLTTTLANEMRRRDVELGLISVCAAGGLGLAMVLERGDASTPEAGEAGEAG